MNRPTPSLPLSRPVAHRWTRDEYLRLTDLGWFAGQRVELVGGRILHMPPQKNPHAFAVTRTQRALEAAFGPSFWVRVQMTPNLGRNSMPDPDVAVVPGPPSPAGDYPTTALLVVEVSDTTLPYDRGRKAQAYARARIPEYWIVNLVDGQVEIRRDPVDEPARRPRYRYAHMAVGRAADVISPVAMPGARLLIADLLA